MNLLAGALKDFVGFQNGLNVTEASLAKIKKSRSRISTTLDLFFFLKKQPRDASSKKSSTPPVTC
jgi:hypothetical protein